MSFVKFEEIVAFVSKLHGTCWFSICRV